MQVVELLAQLKPVMKEHLRRIQDEETNQHYLGGGRNIQNEIIHILSDWKSWRNQKDVAVIPWLSAALQTFHTMNKCHWLYICVYLAHSQLNGKSVEIYEHIFGFITI